ncbi:probable ATP-dependent RNA helicase DHX37 [Tetranychus urticae]|uniref:RNA helicase n=1 Tax=Tetranychus urticae TaxID=32264 RepID=T1K9Z5_TETUR|nr:probable ATP-dependent RNA helicase DHX37 [Tetranychus urticae]
MGRSIKRRRNIKARSGGKDTIKSAVKSKSSVAEIPIELEVDHSKYDSSNPLILPSNKNVDGVKDRKSDVQSKKKPKKVLSLKKKKKLQKVLDRKKRIQDRSSILDELKKHQLDTKTYSAMSSTSNLHTKGYKRNIDIASSQIAEVELSKIKTSARKRMRINTLEDANKKVGNNVLGFDRSDDDSDGEEKEEEDDDNDDEGHGENEEEEIKEEEPADVTNQLNLNDKENLSTEQEKNKVVEVLSKWEPEENSVADEVVDKSENEKPSESSKVPEEQLKTVDKDVSNISKEVTMKPRFVSVNRDPEIQKSREGLPIYSKECEIMETINDNDVTILCGETGSGKTTQIPQFLYEAGYAIDRKIGITEPRRVAAIAMASRVGHEMNLSSDIVSYQIRFEGNCTDETKIKFMTDGILLKEIQKDFLLSDYSVIIIDEAHERTVYSDILIGLLSRIIKLRSKKNDRLRLIIMSATLRIDDFKTNPNLFKTEPPVINIEVRQYPINVYHNKVTPEDYIHAAYSKVCKIHKNMPKRGGILVFLTGQQEVLTLCRKLRQTFPFNENSLAKQKEKEEEKEIQRVSRKEAKKLRKTKPKTLGDIMPQIDLNAFGDEIDLADDVSDEDGNNESSDEDDDNVVSCSDPLYCLPLFSHLNEKRQRLIFEKPPEGVRLCVVATNIAETSLTIPNIEYVIDTGKVKMKYYDQTTGISTFLIDWISQSSADQRAGRSGRTGKGHCYRLYSSAVYNDFKKFSDAEIVRKPIDDLVLQMKSMNIDNVANFPFPTPPSSESILAAEKRLVLLGALKETKVCEAKIDKAKNKTQAKTVARITPLGRTISLLPLSPRFAKMIILASKQNLISYSISIVSALTVQEIFVSQSSVDQINEDGTKKVYKDRLSIIRKKWAGIGNSLLLGDMMIFLCAIGAWEHVDCIPAFCSKYGLRLKAMNEIRKLRIQLLKETSTIFPQLGLSTDLKMLPPTDGQAKALRQILLSGLFDHVARIMPDDEKDNENRRILKNAYKSIEVEQPVYISNDSVLNDVKPEWIVYQEIYETQKLYMRNVVAIEPEWIPIYAPNMCTFSKPMNDPPPRYDSEADCVKCTVNCNFGPYNWILPDTEIEFPESIDKYRWFTRFLLEGLVIDYFISKRSSLLSTPAIMQKSWAKLQKRTEFILNSLANHRICSKKSLIAKWNEDPKYLLTEFLKWIPEALHFEIQSEWPPLEKST